MSIFTENLQGKDLTAADKYIYLFLVNNFSEAGACDLPNEKLCELLEVSLSTFRKSIKTLQEKKLVKIQRFPNKRVLKFTTLVKNTTLVIFTTPIKIYYPTESIKNLNKSESYLASWTDFSIKIWELERKEAKERSIILLYTYSININISSINKEEGKSSLTSFASTSLKYYIGKFDFVNDPDHRNINKIQNSLIPTEPAKTSLAEIAKAPAKRKRAKKTVENFKPPSSSEEVEIFMQSYVEKSLKKYPYLIYVDIQRSADDFLSYYTMNNWKQSKNKPIVDWKAAAEKWLRNQQDYIKKGTAEPKQLTLHEQELFDRLTNNQQIDEQRFNNAVDVSEGDSEGFTQVQAFEHKETPEEYAERQRREIEEYRRTLYED